MCEPTCIDLSTEYHPFFLDTSCIVVLILSCATTQTDISSRPMAISDQGGPIFMIQLAGDI